MKEDFLHFLWKHQKFPSTQLKTTQGISVQVLNPGTINRHSGPDFFDSRITFDALEWAGNVEVHVKSSDWFSHQHHKDKNYDSVILHVVWEDDIAVMTKSGSVLPTLELSKVVEKKWIERYQKQFSQKPDWIPCESQIDTVNTSVWLNWKERLFVERLEQKSKLIEQLL